jgi:hypothetical protein
MMDSINPTSEDDFPAMPVINSGHFISLRRIQAIFINLALYCIAMKTVFEYDLEKGQTTSDAGIGYAVRYVREEVPFVEIGDSYRHNIRIESKHWNRLLKIIRNGELDREAISAITKGLMYPGLPEEYEQTFVSAVKSGIIKEM